mmetsp:Transcript_17796/g.50656  ORF Transcript_17796/g.50656 Transcript_17796/m.50656 type:complete len:96 (-) Transcript_17796:126-413(-)
MHLKPHLNALICGTSDRFGINGGLDRGQTILRREGNISMSSTTYRITGGVSASRFTAGHNNGTEMVGSQTIRNRNRSISGSSTTCQSVEGSMHSE